MNKPVTQSELTAAHPLVGRVSLVTGSTSGIGLEIAKALAAAGSAIAFKGFGKAEDISATQAIFAAECRWNIPAPIGLIRLQSPK